MRTFIEAVLSVSLKAPSAIALRDATRTVTYDEFVQGVRSLAARLRAIGADNSALVAIHLPRSVEMVTAIVATMWTGAAFVPLDPDMPVARKKAILDDSGARFVISQLREEWYPSEAINLIPSSSTIQTGADPAEQSLAYVTYTSGSTGRPKGVAIESRSLHCYLKWATEALPFVGVGVPIFGSIAYDHVLTSLLPPLMMGEPLVLLPRVQSGGQLADALLTADKYSYVKLTPSHVRMLSIDDRARLGTMASLLIFGGEQLSPDLVVQVRRDNPSLPVLNHYGPTECTVGCCAYFIPHQVPSRAVPIGRPIAENVASVRDENGAMSNSGRGELWIAGPGLARGYWRNDELTRQAFVDAPDGQGVLRRWYRTGDLVVAGDGVLTYVGRSDDQIKVMGHRVEPAEIEAELRKLPGILNAAVLSVERAGRPEIIAAVAATHDVAEVDVRLWLRDRLPSAMIPARIICYSSLPVLANGKLDRATIIAEASEAIRGTAREEARRAILEKWRTTLGDDELSPDADFFEVGGDSIAEIEICAWASEAFQVDVSPTSIFEYPTVESFTSYVSTLVEAEVVGALA